MTITNEITKKQIMNLDNRFKHENRQQKLFSDIINIVDGNRAHGYSNKIKMPIVVINEKNLATLIVEPIAAQCFMLCMEYKLATSIGAMF